MRKMFFWRHIYFSAGMLLCLAALPEISYSASIAVITRSDIVPYRTFVDSYKEECRKFGRDRHTLQVFSIDSENADEKNSISTAIAAYKPDIIVCTGTTAVKFARENFQKIPLIYSMVLNPREIQDTGKPGMIGVSMEIDAATKFNVLREIKPDIRKAGTVYDPAESGEQVKEAVAAARKAGIEFLAVPVSSPREAVTAIEKVMAEVDAFMLFLDRTVLTPQTVEALFISSFRSKVPVIGFSEKYVSLGALLSIEVQISDFARETWKYTEECLAVSENCQGKKKATSTGKIVINRKIAEKMGLKIPDSIKARSSFFE